MSFRLSKDKDAISRPKPISSFDMPYILLLPNYSEIGSRSSMTVELQNIFLFNIAVVLVGVDHRSLRYLAIPPVSTKRRPYSHLKPFSAKRP